MKSNYKRLGDYISEVDVRNQQDKKLELWGVSIEKKFIKSVANIIGTDLSKYKIISKNCFVCSLMQVSRDEKIPIARWNDKKDVIVSPAYKVFRVIDTSILMPEFMDLWFKRAEFDREASFYGVGGVRGSLEWEDFCEMRMPVPSIEEQEKIVDAYQKIEDRIALKRKINDNLEAQARSLFANYFMDNIESTIHKFGEYVTFLQGTQVPIEEQFSIPTSSMVRFVRIIDYTTHEKEPKRYILKPTNATYVNKDEVSIVRYGNIGLIGRRIEGIIANNLFKVVSKGKLSNSFIYYYLTQDIIQHKLKFSEESSAMPAIKHSTVANLPINTLDDNSLTRFDKFCLSIEPIILANNKELFYLFDMQSNILTSLSN